MQDAQSGAELLHVTTPAAWASGAYARAPDGFWHLCTPAQLPFVLGRHFAGRSGLLVLHLDPARLHDVRWEQSEPGMAPFPHLYGALPAEAVLRVEALPPA